MSKTWAIVLYKGQNQYPPDLCKSHIGSLQENKKAVPNLECSQIAKFDSRDF